MEVPRLEHVKVDEQYREERCSGGDFHVHRPHVEAGRVAFVLLTEHIQIGRLRVEFAQRRAALQDIVEVLHHDPLHVLQFVSELDEVTSNSRVLIVLFRLLRVRVEFDERVRPRHVLHAVAVVLQKFVADVLEKGERLFATERPLAQREEDDAVFDQIVEVVVARLNCRTLIRRLAEFFAQHLRLILVFGVDAPQLLVLLDGRRQRHAVGGTGDHRHQNHGSWDSENDHLIQLMSEISLQTLICVYIYILFH